MQREELPLPRAERSCDACRDSKVRVSACLSSIALFFADNHKCIRSRAGQCSRCYQLSSECTFSRTRRSRPYYQTSKEQYELMTTALRHFVPGISFQIPELRNVVSQLSTKHPTIPAEPESHSNISEQASNITRMSQSFNERSLLPNPANTKSVQGHLLDTQPSPASPAFATPSSSAGDSGIRCNQATEAIVTPSLSSLASYRFRN